MGGSWRRGASRKAGIFAAPTPPGSAAFQGVFQAAAPDGRQLASGRLEEGGNFRGLDAPGLGAFQGVIRAFGLPACAAGPAEIFADRTDDARCCLLDARRLL